MLFYKLQTVLRPIAVIKAPPTSDESKTKNPTFCFLLPEKNKIDDSRHATELYAKPNL